MAWKCFYIFMTLLLLQLSYYKVSCNSSFISDEQRLMKDLFADYNKNLRPVKATGDKVTVHFGLALISLYELNIQDQSMTSLVWLRSLWHDFSLEWEPSNYGNVTVLRMPHDMLWKPDLVLYNSVDTTSNVYQFDAMLLVYSSGNIMWIPPMVLKSSCHFDLTYFPFDEQTCQLKFGSWAYDGNAVNIDYYEGQEAPDLSDYILNHEWELKNVSGKINRKYYPCCPEPYPDETYNFTFTRRGDYYMYIFGAPGILLGLMTPSVFLASHDSRQKMTIGGVVVLSLILLINMFQHFAQHSSHLYPPLILKMYIVQFIMVSLSMIVSALIGNFTDSVTNQGKHPPEFLRKIFIGCLGKLCGVGGSPYNDLEQQEVDMTAIGQDNAKDELVDSKGGQRSGRSSDWYLIAVVIDRLLFIIFLILSIIFLIVFLQ